MRTDKSQRAILSKAFKPYADQKLTPFERKIGKARPELVKGLLERLESKGLASMTKAEQVEAIRALGAELHQLRSKAHRRADPETGKLRDEDAFRVDDIQDLYDRLKAARPRS